MNLVFVTFFIASCLFSVGLFGVLLSTRNLISVLVSIEAILLGAVLNFCAVATSVLEGHVAAILVITVAAAEAAIALAIVVVYFKKSGAIDVRSMSRLKG
ncbi:NADH-ubiquinone/plastoquinone oxidoreductase chain 4L family protein [Neorickettsia helminthoeca str. Oregon]|uniref:NADH-quinone oxidoreductase subunit K n=1 Tax=Neorickettsia helminthoeca str. Oregon TaxID=1286528 RepID=X5GVE5_9RICK|nr:NADH-quinone oxidoreductase subunit NuoK [Neorickettsia helminthoeca]AHX10992.1 NADH-ubiquinone/plastoquinone oxidoreductase chain 4L family protein [Neorickettsia helminthoeca str. Oregon]